MTEKINGKVLPALKDDVDEQEFKDEGAGDAAPGDDSTEAGSEGKPVIPGDGEEAEVDEEPGDARGQGGYDSRIDNPPELGSLPPAAFPGQAETLAGRIARVVDVQEAVQKYVDRFMPYAAKGKYKMPPANPEVAHQFTIVEDRMVLWLMPQKPKQKYTRVRFIFTTEDGVNMFVTEDLELASSERLDEAEKDVRRALADARGSGNPRSLIIH
jgi:hypothetical protein